MGRSIPSVARLAVTVIAFAIATAVASGCSDRSEAHVFAKRPQPLPRSADFPPPAPAIDVAEDVSSSPRKPEFVFAVGPIPSSSNVSWALVAPLGTDLDEPRTSYALAVARSTDGGRKFHVLWPQATHEDVLAMYVHDDQSVTVAVRSSMNVKIERTTDAGVSWLSFSVAPSGGVIGGFFDGGCQHLTLELEGHSEEVYLLGKARDRAWRVSRRGASPGTPL